MTREELKEHCKKQVESCEKWAIARGEEPNGKVYEEHKLILELLEQTKWIPVSERLPEESIKQIMLGDEHTSDFVLVTIKGQTYPFPKAKVKVARYSYTYKAWQIANNNFGKVVAWMPLPEPYREESEDKE